MIETKATETKTEYLNQKEHAARLGIARQTVSKNQRLYNLFKTVNIGTNVRYVWIDGEPQYNEMEETDNENN